jgi:hypothetical protein
MRILIIIFLSILLATGCDDKKPRNTHRSRDMTASLASQGYTTYELNLIHPNMFQAEGSIKGNKVNFLIDTGASHTIINKATAQRLALPLEPMSKKSYATSALGATRNLHICRISEWELDGKPLPAHVFAVMDMEGANAVRREQNSPEIDFILGGDFLIRHEAIINIPDHLLFLRLQP